MSKGGWARLIKQQLQESVVDYHEDNSMKYKNISSKQQLQIKLAELQSINVNSSFINTSTSSTSVSPPSTYVSSASIGTIRGPMSQVALHDQGVIKANKILQVVRKWRSQSAKNIATARHRSSLPAHSSSCTKRGLMPLSCVTFSSIHLHSDDEDGEEEEEDINDEKDFKSDRGRKSKPIRRRHARHARPPARRTLSCPKLGPPLGLCTPFPSIKGTTDSEDNYEAVECGRGNNEERLKLSPSSSSSSPSVGKPPTTPKGYLALYVGEERRRFLVKANLLNHPLFGILLNKAKEEFGFDQQGPLNIPCEISFFQHIMLLVESNHPSYRNADHSTLLLHLNSPNLAATVM